MKPTETGLIAAYLLDGQGGGTPLDWDGIAAWKPEDGTMWVHLDYEPKDARTWILEKSQVDSSLIQALVAEETRPRSVVASGGLLVILRGANLTQEADPEDMVSVRVWLEEHRIITTRHRRIMSVDSIRQSIVAGRGPVGPGDFLVHLTDGLTARIGEVLTDLNDEVDALEDEVLSAKSYDLRTKIGAFRRSAIRFRRHLAPQKDTILHLQSERVSWMSEADRANLREIGDRTLRYVEDLDSARDRAAVAQDELTNRLSEQMNKTMYVLSIVAGIFLPLGLLTGLLGINVGGMPGVEDGSAFLIVCIILLVTASLQIWFFKRKGWM